MSIVDSAKEIIDLSVPLKSLDTPIYPGYPQPLKASFTTVRDNGYASFIWTFVEHTSTHVDSPGHFVPNAPWIDKVPISKYVSNGVVLELKNKPPRYSITRNDVAQGLAALHKTVGPGWAILFHTGYTAKARSPDWLEHPDLSDDACNFIADLGVNAVGFDAPGPDHAPFGAHKILLSNMVSIYENLTNLDKLLGKTFVLVAAPLALEGGSASPVRAVAIVL